MVCLPLWKAWLLAAWTWGGAGVWEVEGQAHVVWLRTLGRQPSVGQAFCDSGVLSSQLTVSWDICADEIDPQQEENSRCLGNQL